MSTITMSAPPTRRIDFHGMPAIHLRSPDGAEATVLEYGGHVVSWKPAGGVERLYLSPKALYERGKPVRGGIPVIFPQFGRLGPITGHGFARIMDWQFVDARAGEDHATVQLVLKDSETTRAEWPHLFSLEIAVSVSGVRLDVEIEVTNHGDDSFDFTAALHTYLAVAEVEETSLEGLRGQRYRDSVIGKDTTETGTALMVDREVDRIYYETRNPLLVREPRRALAVHAENMPETVVWNPWEERVKALKDLPDDGFRRMLCVESAVIEKPVVLAPDASWWGRQTLMAL